MKVSIKNMARDFEHGSKIKADVLFEETPIGSFEVKMSVNVASYNEVSEAIRHAVFQFATELAKTVDQKGSVA